MTSIPIIFLIAFNVMAYFIPKKLSQSEMYSTSLFALVYGTTTDMILDLHYNLYGYFNKGFQWSGLLVEYLYFPAISILFLNLFPFSKKLKSKLIYFIGWELFSIIFEWCSVHTHLFYYNGWKLWYSVLVYPFIFLTLLINLKILRSTKRS